MNDGDVIKLQFIVGFLVVNFGFVAFREGFAGVADLFAEMTVEVIVVSGLFAFWLVAGRP